ncbi:MAG TPA: ribosome small subunit-dependent GTPase A [Steroidobacteraceae bacterium]|nr:ribosome small subunit-dependent GTPase A [Steroidobacteraceae bacterium]
MSTVHFSPVFYSLEQIGWRAHFAQQVSLAELADSYPARVAAIHRSGPIVMSERGIDDVVLGSLGAEVSLAVGDWVLVENDARRVLRVLERQSLVSRLSAGSVQRVQEIAANLDTLFIVTSCDDDFSLSRLERYLSAAYESKVTPAVVLTKIDLCADPASFEQEVAAIAPLAACLLVNATQPDGVTALAPWVGKGQTVAFVGSSGVGKSTLVNSLLGSDAQATGATRTSDGTGKHTTTARQLLAMSSGAWLIDTPGMREFRIGAAEEGVRTTFADIEALAEQCRFRDCHHAADAGCAVASSILDGSLDERRLENYRKLQREAQRASRTVRERREQDRHFGRLYKNIQEKQRKLKGN